MRFLGRIVIAGCFLVGTCVRGDTLYVSNHNASIEKYDVNGNGSTFGSSIPGSPLQGAGGLAFDKNGNLFVAADDGIFKYTPSGAASIFARPIALGGAQGAAFSSNGTLFVAYRAGGTIEEFQTNGNATTFVAGLIGLSGIAFDPTGNLFVATPSAIEELSSTGTETLFASGFNSLSGLVFDKSGNLFAADSASNQIWKFGPKGGQSVYASTGFNEPVGLAFDHIGNLFVANAFGNTISRVDTSGNVTQFASVGGPTYLAVQVPEPATWMLLAMGAGTALLALRSRRQSP